MKRSYHKLLNIGAKKVNSNLKNKRIRVFNLILFIGLIHTVFFIFLNFIEGERNTLRFIFLLGEILFLAVTLFLNAIGKFNISKVIFIILSFIVLYNHCNVAYIGAYGEYQYIITPLITLFFFNKRWVHFSTLITSLSLFYIPNIYLNIYPKIYFGYINSGFLFVGIFFMVDYFRRLNNKNEKLLAEEKDKAISDKIILEKQESELRKLNEYRSIFFVNLSHEIKTPLTLINGYTTQVLKNKDLLESKEHLYIIKEQTQQIQNIIDSIMDLSKIDNNTFNLNVSWENLNSILKNQYINFLPLIEEKEISFTLQNNTNKKLVTLVDLNFFTKALSNLLSNALKFTSKGGTILLIANYEKKNIILKIIDSGIGISKYEQQNVFKRFYQIKNDINKSQGTGIGLAFTKNIIEKHKFKIFLKSNTGKGSEFKIIIPEKSHTIQQQETIIKTTKKSTTKNNNIPKILIVEDHEKMRAYLKTVLNNFNVTEAENGKQALQILEEHSFDLIITDFMMPVMDGEELIKNIKNRNLKTPIIVLSARNDDYGKLTMLRLGIDNYINKPFSEEELKITINRCLKLYKNIRDFDAESGSNEIKLLNKSHEKFNLKLKNYINENLKSNILNIDTIAEHMNFSRSTLTRKTKSILGQTVNEIIIEARLEKARDLLTHNPEMSKKEIINIVGVTNTTYFFNQLKNRYNMEKIYY